MGTLFEQRPRQEYLGSTAISWLVAGMRECGYDSRKPADVHAFCDLMRTALAIQSADALDEQLAGFGEIFQSLVRAIEELREAIDDK